MQKFVSEPSADLRGYVIARYNEVKNCYEPLPMTPGQQELIEKLARELNLGYKKECEEIEDLIRNVDTLRE